MATLRVNFNTTLTFSNPSDIKVANASDVVLYTIDTSSEVDTSILNIDMDTESIDLDGGTTYKIQLDPGTVTDPVTGLANETINQVFVSDNGPGLSSSVPVNNGSTEPFNTLQFDLDFGENVTVLTGNIYIYRYADDILHETFDVTTDITHSGSTLSFTPGNFASGTSYYIIWDANIVRSTVTRITNIATTVANKDDWRVIVSGLNYNVANFSPADNALASSAGFGASAWFDQTLNTVLTGNVYIYRRGVPNVTSDDTLITTIDVTTLTPSGQTLPFTVPGGLETGEDHYIIFDKDIVQTATGRQNNALGNNAGVDGARGDGLWNFYTDTGTVSEHNLVDANYQGTSFSVSTQMTTPKGMFFEPSGTSVYLTDGADHTIYQYDLSTAWSIASASYASKSFSISAQATGPRGIFWKPDGTVFYVVASSDDNIYQYNCSTAWDVSTASYASISYDLTNESTGAGGIKWKPNGRSFFVTFDGDNTVKKYQVTTQWDVSTAVHSSDELSTTTQDSAPKDVYIESQGKRVFVLGGTNNTVYQYTSTYPYSFSSTGVNAPTFSFTAEETTANAIFFNNTGTKMYAVGETSDAIYEYPLEPVAPLNWETDGSTIAVSSFTINIVQPAAGNTLLVIAAIGDNPETYDSTSMTPGTWTLHNSDTTTTDVEVYVFSKEADGTETSVTIEPSIGTAFDVMALTVAEVPGLWDYSTSTITRNVGGACPSITAPTDSILLGYNVAQGAPQYASIATGTFLESNNDDPNTAIAWILGNGGSTAVDMNFSGLGSDVQISVLLDKP
jgi:sugar lactone lactonase YvrE